jgi:hypothetical protein
LSVHEKFFCDALTEYKCIPDDADQFITSSYYTSEINDTIKVVVKIYTNMAKPKVFPPFIQAAIDKKAAKGGKGVTPVTPATTKKPAIKIVTKTAMKPKAKMPMGKKAC